LAQAWKLAPARYDVVLDNVLLFYQLLRRLHIFDPLAQATKLVH